MKVVLVKWQDHYSAYGWFAPEDVEAKGHLNISAGILIEKNHEHTTIAQTAHADGSQYADLLHILTKDIIKIEELN